MFRPCTQIVVQLSSTTTSCIEPEGIGTTERDSYSFHEEDLIFNDTCNG